MQSAIDQFASNIARVKELGGLHAAIVGLLTAIVDPSDLLRAQHVLAVSALDHYMHDVARLGILEIFDGIRPPTRAYGRLRASLSCFTPGMTANALRSALEADIREQHGYLSFQKPDKVAEAARWVTDTLLWDAVATSLGRPSDDVKNQLTLIVDRRNKIAHEADLDPTFPNQRWPIHPSDVATTVSFLEDLVQAIHLVVT